MGLSVFGCSPKAVPPPPPPPPVAAVPAPPKVVAPPKKILNFSISDDVKSGDPANFNDVISAGVMGNIFDGLYGFKYLGKMGAIEPVLAEALPVYSDKNKTLTIKLKKGILFQDEAAFENGKGREVTADDVIYSFKRIGDPSGTSTNWWMFDEMIVGFNEWRSAVSKAKPEDKVSTFNKPIPGLLSSDPNTIVIKVTKPYPQLMDILSMNPTAVVAREVVEKYGPDIINHPVGTGPFKLKEWVRGSKIVIERNPTYRQDLYPSEATEEEKAHGLLEAAGKKMPFVDELQYDIIKEEQPRWLMFKSGQLAEAGIPKDNFKEAIGADGNISAELSQDGVSLHKVMSLTSWWLEFNLKDPVLGKNKNLRKAIAFAFDRAKALTLLYNDRGVLSSGPVPPAVEGGSNPPPFPYTLNLVKAKKALADAGFPNGKKLEPLTLDLRGPGQTARQFGELLQSNLAAIGIKLNVIANSFPEALEKAKTSRFQIMLSGWAADYPDPENFLALWYGPNEAPGNNSSNFHNKEFDKLYTQIRIQMPGPDREKAVRRMSQILMDEVPGVYFFHAMDYSVTRNWLKNYQPHLLLYGLGKFMDIDTELRAKSKH